MFAGPGVQGSLILDPAECFSVFLVAADRTKGEGRWDGVDQRLRQALNQREVSRSARGF